MSTTKIIYGLYADDDDLMDGVKAFRDKGIDIKKKTFELYCRDSRNIKILTYDELYRRAKFIVESAEK